MTEEVISFTPSRQVLTFDNYKQAKRILLEKYHSSIIQDAEELAKKFSANDLYYISKITLGLKEPPTERDRFKLAQLMWPMLIVAGRRTRDASFSRNVRTATLPTHVTYFCDYAPGEDSVRDLSYYKLPPQAKVLVDMFVDKLTSVGDMGVPEFLFIKYINELKETGRLVTRQGAMQIWSFYKNILTSKGFIQILHPNK
jgi:hypothetical protein